MGQVWAEGIAEMDAAKIEKLRAIANKEVWSYSEAEMLCQAAPEILAYVEKLETALSEFADPNNWDGVMWSPPRHSGMDFPVDIARRALEKKVGFERAKGILPWKEGDELPEDAIRRQRDSEP